MTLASPLPEQFWRKAQPLPVAAPRYLARNTALAQQLGLASTVFDQTGMLEALSGNGPWPDFEPVALAYSGHQFGNWNPLMGDGRAHLIATLKAGWELHLKGSGATPFSRNGDGRAALGPMLREYIISEAFAGLGIPSTRSLSVVATGEDVYRRTLRSRTRPQSSSCQQSSRLSCQCYFASGHIDRTLDVRRFYSWRHEYRQYGDIR
jgi:serine/tyrosine/threonine adenylyltransferase